MEITIDISDLGKALKDIEAYKEQFKASVTETVKQATEIGKAEAEMRFTIAKYDGTNDVQVKSTVQKKTGTITASGKSVLFIEFGTGIYYGGGHPEGNTFGYVPGSYGPNGLKDYWFYKGEPGTNGVPSTKRPGSIITHGNPANKCMYDAAKEVERSVGKIAREVFK